MGNKRKYFSCSRQKKKKITAYARQIKKNKKNIIEDVSKSYDKSNMSNVVSNISNGISNHGDMEHDVFSALIEDLTELENTDTGNCGDLRTVNDESDNEDFEFTIEPSQPVVPPHQIEGRRIIDFEYFVNQMQLLSNHNPGLGCTMQNLKILKEKIIGLESIVYFKCNMCHQVMKIYSSENLTEGVTINHAAVTGAMLIGCGRTNLNELLTAVDLPNLNQQTYIKCHNDVSKWWEIAAITSMKEAAQEERELAVKRGDVIDGIPAITVVADACWSKRSYRNNYTAASGAAAIIGLNTGKVLHMQVKNKCCIICTRSALNKKIPPIHRCFKNHVGPSTSMEQASIVEGFKSSVSTHNLIYKTLIADGDASTYKKILESRPYTNVQVEKIECTNHLLRNYASKLMQLQKDTSIPLPERKLLTTERITRLRTAVRAAARFRNAENTTTATKIINLKDDILNSPKHIFGDHHSCKVYYCTKEKDNETNLVPLVNNLLKKLMVHTMQIALHSKSLLHNVNNNRAEQFNSIVAKHVGGKRVNYSLRNSYTARCHAAVVAFNTGKAQYNLHKYNFQNSPRKSIKQLEFRRHQRNLNRTYRPGLKRKIRFQRAEIDYGGSCQKPDLTPEDYETAKKIFLENLKELVAQRHEVERDTILQAESSLWLELRRSLLTASSFNKVCKRRSCISSAPLVKSLAYSYSLSSVPAIEYGKKNEQIALKQLEQQEAIAIQRCGLFIDETFFFLGASPDGIFKDGIVEIKCPYSARNLDAEQAVTERKITFWTRDGLVNTNHDWYFQIQGQLHISKMDVCLFAVWTGPEFPLKTALIRRDDVFWSTKMENKLISFYDKCLLPELIDPRKSRSMAIRDVRF